MIHYTLLPEKEIKTLKKEYRTRLFIILLFFVSCAVLVGIGSLTPAYIFSYTEEREALKNLETLRQSRQNRGTDNVIIDLTKSAAIVKQLEEYDDSTMFSQLISQIVSYKPANLYINSLDLKNVVSKATTSIEIIVQGKASTREDLTIFGDRLKADPLISNVVLPVSNLAKSKDISFSIKLSILKLK